MGRFWSVGSDGALVRVFVLIACSLVVAHAMGSFQVAQAVVPTELSLQGPVLVDAEDRFEYEGRFSLAGTGLPAQEIDVLVDGEPVATVTTDTDGFYVAGFVFPDRGIVEVVAVAFQDTPLEARSPALEVIVGPGELSLQGPTGLDRDEPADYTGRLTVTGIPVEENGSGCIWTMIG